MSVGIQITGVTFSGGLIIENGTGGVGSLRFNPTNSGASLLFTNTNTTVTGAGTNLQESAITNIAINAGDKVWFSVLANIVGGPAYTTIGIAKAVWSSGVFVGQDTTAQGYSGDGNAYYNSTPFDSGLPTFGTGDVIDVAVYFVSSVPQMWLRVNGGYWNNDNTANPATNTGGISGGYTVTGEPIYFVVGPNNADQFTLRTTATYTSPAGFTFLGA
tara:strand:+ start:572 stop:1219 length:648 start_codon:yes stop_codon:yes gene_type:complete